MPDLTFAVQGAEPVPYAASPFLRFALNIGNTPSDEAIHSIALRCQIQIEAVRRRYSPADQERLLDLFGEPSRWSQTVRTMLWTHAQTVVPRFMEQTAVALDVPCSFDFNIAATKYFYGLDDGEVPLCLLFSGTVFYEVDDGRLQAAQIPWSKETTFRLPVRVWSDMMETYYPNSAWLRLRRDTFDRLYRIKRDRGLPTWEQALDSLLPPENGLQP
jgi:hypothetical protein